MRQPAGRSGGDGSLITEEGASQRMPSTSFRWPSSAASSRIWTPDPQAHLPAAETLAAGLGGGPLPRSPSTLRQHLASREQIHAAGRHHGGGGSSLVISSSNSTSASSPGRVPTPSPRCTNSGPRGSRSAWMTSAPVSLPSMPCSTSLVDYIKVDDSFTHRMMNSPKIWR